MATDLWPEFDVSQQPKTVKRILLDEGSGISEKTDGLIEFTVDTRASGDRFVHDCFLTVPNIGFRYPLMKVTHGIDQYPATIIADTFPQGVSAGNEKAFVENLGLVFRSDITKKTVMRLLATVS